MDFLGQSLLAFIEEDNTQRMLFRVRPLLSEQGVFSERDALEAYPDDGFIRVVPDKNEQHTFKDRMRSLGSLCVLDLTKETKDLGKIRSNKNYAPARHETNRFVVYSDAVRPIPEDSYFQVIQEDAFENAVTSRVYIRNGANITGPYLKDGTKGFDQDPCRIPPDSCDLYNLQLPGGQEILMYHPRTPSQEIPQEAQISPTEEPRDDEPFSGNTTGYQNPAPVSAAEAIIELNNSLAISRANLRDKESSSVFSISEASPVKTNATRLYKAHIPGNTPVSGRTNVLSKAVERQRNPVRNNPENEEPDPFGKTEDPGEPILRSMLRLSPAALDRLAGQFLQDPAVREAVSKSIVSPDNHYLLHAAQMQLEDIEAERLMLLMQLDDARKDLDAYREKVKADVLREAQAESDRIRSAAAESKDAADRLEERVRQLTEERDRLALHISSLSPFEPLSVIPSGEEIAQSVILSRLQQALSHAGFSFAMDDAAILTVSLALCGDGSDLILSGDTRADGFFALDSISSSLGALLIRLPEESGRRIEYGGKGIFLAALGGMSQTAIPHGAVTVRVCGREETPRVYEDCVNRGRHPVVFSLYPDPKCVPAPVFPSSPVALSALGKILAASDLSSAEIDFIGYARKLCMDTGAPLSLSLVQYMSRMISSAKSLLQGGAGSALDYAFRAFVLPHISAHCTNESVFREIASTLPLCSKELAYGIQGNNKRSE